MKNLPIKNFEKFKKIGWPSWQPNCEVFWYSGDTYHCQLKNSRPEGIEIKWEDNPFDLDLIFDYILNK